VALAIALATPGASIAASRASAPSPASAPGPGTGGSTVLTANSTETSSPETSAAAAPTVGGRHTVSYDSYSLMLDGRRIMLQAAEFHYFRLPSPDLWQDILEKQKAVDRLLRAAEKAGVWVVARPGPYINAETTGGGFPSWLKQVPGRARTSAPGYTAAYQDWLSHINPIIARHQVNRGGSVILYQVENQ
jgi:hypothetical protein